MDAPAQEGAGCEQDMPAFKGEPLPCPDAGYPAVAAGDGSHLVLPDGEVLKLKERAAHCLHIGGTIHLAAGGAHSRSLAGIEDAHLDGSGISPQAHAPAKGVYFTHHVGFGQAAYGRIAGKMAQAVQIAGYKQGLVPQRCQAGCCFTARMAAAYDDAVKLFVH